MNSEKRLTKWKQINIDKNFLNISEYGNNQSNVSILY